MLQKQVKQTSILDLTSGAQHWQLSPGWNEGLPGIDPGVLLGAHGLKLPEWLAAGLAQVVKQGPHRTVYRVTLPGLDCHVKYYPEADVRARLRRLGRPNKARRELERSLAVAARGVATLAPLALGETIEGPPASWLITRTLPEAQPLGAFLEHHLSYFPTALRRELARSLGRLVAHMHDGGVAHQDLHPDNILLVLHEDDETPRLYLIDLDAVQLGPPLDWPASRDNLVVLNRWFAMRAWPQDRLRFWLAYQQARGQRLPPVQRNAGVVRDLEERTLESNLAFWRQHDGRCTSRNRYFRELKSGNFAGHAAVDVDPEALDRLLADPDEPFRRTDLVVHKDSNRSTVVELELPCAGQLRRLIYKRFNVTRWSDPLAALFRVTPALRSYQLGHSLRWRGLPTPRPLAVWHRQRCGLKQEGYLLTEQLPQSCDLATYLDTLAALPGPERRRRLRRLIDQVARLLADLHERQLSHRDLKASNLLVSPQTWSICHPDRTPMEEVNGVGQGSNPQVWFIDLVGVSRCGRLGFRRRVRDLMRLSASFHNHIALTRSDRLRFLRAYLAWGLHGRQGWKKWWWQLDQATRSKVRQNQRRGRPLL